MAKGPRGMFQVHQGQPTPTLAGKMQGPRGAESPPRALGSLPPSRPLLPSHSVRTQAPSLDRPEATPQSFTCCWLCSSRFIFTSSDWRASRKALRCLRSAM